MVGWLVGWRCAGEGSGEVTNGADEELDWFVGGLEVEKCGDGVRPGGCEVCCGPVLRVKGVGSVDVLHN